MSYDWLPPLLAEIAEVAGLDAALALAAARGGSRITIPAHPREDHWFTRAIGKEAALRLSDHFRVGNSGAVVELPLGPAGIGASTRRRIDELLRQGVSADRIACTVRVHRTTVFRRKASLDQDDPRQGKLFD
ncbi:MAG TPA: helix-turn-helix domain-containing protein [Paracoccus sp. (in: a-proteobacteria)]|nr:helix-turn-helix domain-containing protein [Paracoccus sp. (in: a-proteobacteria)]